MEKHGRKTDIVKKEGQQYLMERNKMADRLLEKWARTSIGARLDQLKSKELQKARNTAMLIENQEKHLKRLTETIISQTFQTRPENVLKVVRIGTANSNRGDIFTEFPLTTTDDAIYFIDMVYQDSLRGASANDRIYEKVNRYFAGEMVETSGVGNGGTQYTITSSIIPIIRGKTLVMLDRQLIGTDDGNGNLIPYVSQYGGMYPLAAYLKIPATATWNIIDYTTGAVKIELNAAIDASHTLTVLTQWDSENSNLYGQYGKVSLAIRKQRFNARPMPLGYTYSTMTELVLGTTGLGNVEDMLVQTVGDEHAKSRDYKAIGLARSVALTNPTYTFNCDFAAEGEISDKMQAQKILAKIGSIGGSIYNDIKRGRVNKLICGSDALEYLKKHDLWKDDDTQTRTGVFYAGKISDIDVYVCPEDAQLVLKNEILLTFKNPLEGMDVGLAFGVLTELTASLAYPQFYVDGNIASVEDYLVINSKFIRLLSLQNLVL